MIRRPIGFAMLCLVLGVATTVLIAWLLVFDLHHKMRPMRFATAAGSLNRPDISFARSDAFGAYSIAATRSLNEPHMSPEQTFPLNAVIPAWAQHELIDCLLDPARTSPPDNAARAILVTGWPAASMWSSYEQQPSPDYWWFKARDGMVISPAPAFPDYGSLLSPREHVLPLRIVRGGFVISTLFWSASWALAVLLPLQLRRCNRRRRGRCLACNYDLRGHHADGKCPECGAPIA